MISLSGLASHMVWIEQNNKTNEEHDEDCVEGRVREKEKLLGCGIVVSYFEMDHNWN